MHHFCATDSQSSIYPSTLYQPENVSSPKNMLYIQGLIFSPSII